jgi:membrane-associated phospholipid phosphatase
VRLPLIALVALPLCPRVVSAQSPVPAPGATPKPAFGGERAAWVASSALLAASVAFDEQLRSFAVSHQSRELDRLSSGADVLGTAGHIVPALVGTYVTSRLLGQNRFAKATLHVGLSYAMADAIESLLKPTVGRVRPSVGREPLTFRPLSASGNYQSFPSAHVVHIASLGTAVAMEAPRPWVTALAGAAMAYVGAQRVYRNQHWSSDVVASGMLGIEIARTTMHWLETREGPR